MSVDPRRLRYLLAVSRAGSMQGAARALGVTTSAVSQQIATLEREQGIRLFLHGIRRLVPTPAGRILIRTAERIEEELASAGRQLAAGGGDLSGTVVIGSFQTAIRGILVPLMEQLPQMYPGVRIVIREGDDAQLDRWLRAGDVDAIVVERDAHARFETPPRMREVPLVDDPWCVVLPSSEATPSGFDELLDRTWLGVQPGGASAKALSRLSEQFGIRFRTRHEYFEFSVALALVTAGQGIALLPALALTPPVPAGVQIAVLPGLGHRQLFLRHRESAVTGRDAVVVLAEAASDVARREIAKRTW